MKNKRPTKRILSSSCAFGALAGLIITGLISSLSWAETPSAPKTFPIVEREGKRIHQTTSALEDLTSDTSFEGKYFKIVLGSSEVAVPFDAAPELALRAASVYHHLTIARSYYKKLPMDTAHLDKQTTVRVDQELPFSEVIHFVTNGQKVNNGALTIPASTDMRDEKSTPIAWNNEIWFFKGKTVSRKSPLAAVGNQLGSLDFKLEIAEQLLFQDATNLGTALTTEPSIPPSN